MDMIASGFIPDSLAGLPSRPASSASGPLTRFIGVVALTLAVIIAWLGLTVGYFVYLVG